jgi:GNAT superfamily N-acetyltransferase
MQIIQLNHASCQLHEWDNTSTPKSIAKGLRTLSHLYVNEAHRFKGEGSALLKHVADIADKEQFAIVLEPAHYETPTENLITFYTKNGYEKLQDEPYLMVRFPKQTD